MWGNIVRNKDVTKKISFLFIVSGAKSTSAGNIDTSFAKILLKSIEKEYR